MPTTPVANARTASAPRLVVLPALALIGGICAGIAWWVTTTMDGAVATGLLAAVLVLLPVVACILVLLHRERALRQAQAALARSAAQAQANEQALKVLVRERDQLARAQHMASAAHEKLARQSATDGLTGITNRRRFDEILQVEWLRAARAHTSMSLLIVDIDHFKRFNDHYGHVAGDECLRRVAHVLQTSVRRAGECVARYGGEEFVVLLPGAAIAQAEELAQRCLDAIAAEALPHAASPTAAHVTFSIGIAHAVPDPADDPSSLINAADAAMYRAKTAGRARYAVAGLADWEIDSDTPRTQAGDLI
ncbi:MAG: GGDEF domain-containing protein [Rhodoferax sp.]|nr:GGDEF domain-containing protein [Rhodoferax sp.]MCW5645083.1 GGDEF domain-containing protein [Rhodoferax sp.]